MASLQRGSKRTLVDARNSVRDLKENPSTAPSPLTDSTTAHTSPSFKPMGMSSSYSIPQSPLSTASSPASSYNSFSGATQYSPNQMRIDLNICVIICPQVLPDMSGFEFASQVKQLGEGAPPVISLKIDIYLK